MLVVSHTLWVGVLPLPQNSDTCLMRDGGEGEEGRVDIRQVLNKQTQSWSSYLCTKCEGKAGDDKWCDPVEVWNEVISVEPQGHFRCVATQRRYYTATPTGWLL